MLQCKHNSHSIPSLSISTASLNQLTTLPAKVLHLHLASYHLVITGTKAAMTIGFSMQFIILVPQLPLYLQVLIMTATTLENVNTITSSSSSPHISVQSGVTSDNTSVQLATLI